MIVFSSNNQCSHEVNLIQARVEQRDGSLAYALVPKLYHRLEIALECKAGRSGGFGCSLQWRKARVSESAWHSDPGALSPEVLIRW